MIVSGQVHHGQELTKFGAMKVLSRCVFAGILCQADRVFDLALLESYVMMEKCVTRQQVGELVWQVGFLAGRLENDRTNQADPPCVWGEALLRIN